MQYRPDSYNFYEFNLSSPVNYGYSLAVLIPNPECIPYDVIQGNLDTPEFDIQYGQFIMQSPERFRIFMNLVLPLYNDPCSCVIVYVAPSRIRDIIMECIIKIIQQRYGYSSYIVNDLEDICCVRDDVNFTPRGILNIQEDSDRALLEGYYGPIVIPKE